MKKLMEYIKFKICFLLHILLSIVIVIFVVSAIVKVPSVKTIALSLKSLWPILRMAIFFIVLYINLGFIKISNVLSNPRLRENIMVIVVLQFVILYLSFFTTTSGFYMPNIFFAIGGILINLFYFFGFKSVEKFEHKAFSILSNRYLFVFILSLAAFLFITLNLVNIAEMDFVMLMLMSLVMIVLVKLPLTVVYILIWYWQVVIFYRCYAKYEKTHFFKH